MARFAHAPSGWYAARPLSPQPFIARGPRDSGRRSALAAALYLAFCTVVLTTRGRAEAQADLAGSYKAGSTDTKVEVSTWGEDCGPRPRSSSDNSRPAVAVKAQGTQLALTFPDRTLRTNACWSPNPAVRVVNATSSTDGVRRWRTECQTPSSDAKRERGLYTLTASSEGVLELLEESSYDWQLNESRCVAKIRVTQRIARGAALASLDAPANAAEPGPAPAGCTPGPLAKLRLRPSELRVGPGERSCFSVRGTDAAGCVVTSVGALKWDLTKPSGASATLSGGCFKAASSAAEAEGTFRVTVSAGSLRDEAAVTVRTADLSDITAKRGGTDSELEIDQAGDSSAISFGIEAAVKRSSTGVKVTLCALLLSMLGGLGWFVLRSRAAKPLAGDVDDLGFATTQHADEAARPARSGAPAALPASKRTPGAPSSGTSEQLICPQCRHGYPAGTTRCPRDGATPMPYAEFVRQAQAEASGPRTCTACGAQLAAGAQFCGVCGEKVRS